MEILLTLVVVLLIINRNIKTCNHHEFIKQLALATSNRYSVEYSKLRSHDESIEELNLHLHLINPCHGFMNPFNYEVFAGEDALIQSGRYKGESKATRLFFESPLILMNKTIYRGLHPEEGIPFFKQ